jgi:hypothetical protein
MGTNKGISGFYPQTPSFENYMTSDGLPGNDRTGWAACSKRPDGELLFGGFDGGVAFHRILTVDDHPKIRRQTQLALAEIARRHIR